MVPRFFLLISAVWLGLACASPARAQDLFTVSGVHVDASAASSTEAANAALADGRPKAWQTLYRRLTRQQDWARLPQLDEDALQRISRGTSIANERRSTTRYVADVTYMFNPDAVARILRDAGIAYTQSIARRILLVPMAPGYVTRGLWADALAEPRLKNSVVPFSLPNSADVSLAGIHFESASWADVQAAADRIHVSEVDLIQPNYASGHFTVNIRRLSPTAPAAANSVDVPPADPGIPFAQNIPANYAAAADSALAAIAESWKSRSAVDFSVKGNLVADVRADTLAEWGAIQSELAAVSDITSVNVIAMDIGEQQVAISYLGSADQLRAALGAQGLTLVNRGGAWSLTPVTPAPVTPAPATPGAGR